MEARDTTTRSDHFLQLDTTSGEVVARSGFGVQPSDRGVGNRDRSCDSLEREHEAVVGDRNGSI